MIDLDGFGDDARAAVATAAVEADHLGHAAIGTEHLLLGVLLGESGAARVLAESGATVAAARHKAGEASAPRRPGEPAPETMTSRAERAVGRAVRFSHQARCESVGADHLLLGVLDVEGTAGQVLRGVGVDVAALRLALQASTADHASPVPPPAREAVAAPRCPACGAAVEGLAFSPVTATAPDGRTGEVVVFSCASCGVVLGVSPRRTSS